MKKLILFFSLIMLFSCTSDDEETTPPPFLASEIEFIEIWQGQGSGGDASLPEMNLVINNDEVWQDFLVSTGLGANNVIADAEIDFNTHAIIAVILEVKPTGWFVEITSITQYENRVQVVMEDFQDVTQLVSQPFHIVKIPATDDDFVFQLLE